MNSVCIYVENLGKICGNSSIVCSFVQIVEKSQIDDRLLIHPPIHIYLFKTPDAS